MTCKAIPPPSHILHLTSHVLRLTSHVLRLTSHVLRLTLAIVLGIVMLGGCGGGGGKKNGGGNVPPTLSLTFQLDSSITPGTSDFIALSLNTAESTNTLAVLDMKGTGLSAMSVSGLSADLRFDSTKMTFLSFEADTAGAGVGLAAPLETDANTLVLGFYSMNADGRLGKLKFQMNGASGQSSALSFTSLAYISSSSNLLTTPVLTGQGGTLSN